MKAFTRFGVTITRRFHTSRLLQSTTIKQVDSAHSAAISVDTFRKQALEPEKPLLVSRGTEGPLHHLNALNRWFQEDGSGCTQLTAHVTEHEDWPFPFEVVAHQGDSMQIMESFRDWLMKSGEFKDQILAGTVQSIIGERDGQQTFFQLYAPLRLLTQALQFNNSQRDSQKPQLLQVYIAQSSLSDLPPPLQADVQPPELVLKAGKGDVYASSIWLGTEPTFTPLHRDPNPNLFCQLHGTKVVRLLPPKTGEMLYFEVQARIRQQGSSRIRTAEGMMQGLERRVLEDAVWGDDVDLEEMREAKVEKGDALFIPKGWWHSIRSWESQGALNGSANWWFR
jgi:hypothetical protein